MGIPQLSIEERDRRYKVVRAEMAQRKIDVLLLPANTGRWEQLQGDSRYLTSIGGFATEVFTVFPREGDVTATGDGVPVNRERPSTSVPERLPSASRDSA